MLLFLLCLLQAFAQDSNCWYEDPVTLNYWDLSPIQSAGTLEFGPSAAGHTYYLQLCADVTSCGSQSCGCNEATPTCMFAKSGSWFALSALSTQRYVAVGDALTIEYEGGETCIGRPRSATINCACGVPDSATSLTNVAENNCNYIFSLASPACCKVEVTGSGSNGGWIFIGLLIAALVLYFGIGAFVGHRQGKVLVLPHWARKEWKCYRTGRSGVTCLTFAKTVPGSPGPRFRGLLEWDSKSAFQRQFLLSHKNGTREMA